MGCTPAASPSFRQRDRPVRIYHTWIIFLAAFRGQSPNVSPNGRVESALNGSVRPALQGVFFETQAGRGHSWGLGGGPYGSSLHWRLDVSRH
jgi:hypothetical protein